MSRRSVRLPPYCCEDTDARGNVRVYFRKPGQRKVRLRGVAWTPSFMAGYEKALRGELTPEQSPKIEGAKSGTWRWLCDDYMKRSASFLQCDPATQRIRRRVLESTWAEPIKPDAKETFGDMPISKMTSKAVRVLRDRKIAHPSAAITRIKVIGYVFSWALEEHEHIVTINPARGVSREEFEGKGDGRHVWTDDEVRRFEEYHPSGTQARRALYELLYTGARPSDVRVFGRQMVSGGWLSFKPKKTKKSSGVTVEIPVLPILAKELELTPKGQMSFIVSEHGKPYATSESFRNWFKDCCIAAGLPHCSSGGLRPAGATFLAEEGATAHQIMAIYGWTKIETAEVYTKKANRKKLARAGMDLLNREQSGI